IQGCRGFVRHDRNPVWRRLPLQGRLNGRRSARRRHVWPDRNRLTGRRACGKGSPWGLQRVRTPLLARTRQTTELKPRMGGEGPESRSRARPFGGVVRRAWCFVVEQLSSSLTRRIVVINLAGLLAFVIGILYLSQSRSFFIQARVQSLLVQGEIIAGAIAA